MTEAIYAVVLAAGKGTRMKSDLAKVLHPLEGRPMLAHVLDTLGELGCEKTVVIVGHQADAVRELCSEYSGVETALQQPQLGTGHAVQQAESALKGETGRTLILCGDVPLLQASTLGELIESTISSKAEGAVLTAIAQDPTGYGRILRDPQDRVTAIVEHKDATEEQRAIREYNTGTYCFDNPRLWELLPRVDRNNAQGEYYLTDVVGLMVGDGLPVAGVVCGDEREVQGINTVDDLARAQRDWEDMFRR